MTEKRVMLKFNWNLDAFHPIVVKLYDMNRSIFSSRAILAP